MSQNPTMQPSHPSPTDAALHARILRSLRRKAGITQQQLAVRLSKSRSFVSRVERGVRQLGDTELTAYLYGADAKLTEFQSLLDTAHFLRDFVPPEEVREDIYTGNAPIVNEQKRIIHILKDYFAGTAAESAFLFGSVARNEHTEASDVDVYFSIPPETGFHLFDLAQMKIDLSERLGRKVDLVMAGSEYNFLKESLQADKIRVHG